MHPSTLSAADFDCGMYVHVLCPSQNLLLSRIWVHLPRLEENWAHLLCQRGIWSAACTSMYYAPAKICCFRTSGPISCAWKKPEEKKDVRHGRRPADVRSQLVGDEQIGTASKANKAEV